MRGHAAARIVITESDRSAGAEVVPRDTRSDTAGDDPRCTCGQIAEKRNSREIGAELASVRPCTLRPAGSQNLRTGDAFDRFAGVTGCLRLTVEA